VILRIAQVQRRKRQREAEYTRRLERDVKSRTEELAERATELEVLNERLVKASITDSLTGLANRRFLLQYLDKEVSLIKRRYSQLSAGELNSESFDLMFMMVDLDHFKTINDSCGHAAGDRVLQDLRDILKDSCRKSDIVIRWGGDELLIVGRDSKPEGLESLAERLRSRIEQHVFELDDGQVVRTTCSIGFASYPFVRSQLELLSWEQVVSVADRALYVAKRTSRNAWVGFMSTEQTPSKGLLAAIRDEPDRLLAEGGLEVQTSIRGVDLVWDCPDSAQERTSVVLQSEDAGADEIAGTVDRDQPVV
jgi:diguanylate cyclase (GGDEF)-like protein